MGGKSNRVVSAAVSTVVSELLEQRTLLSVGGGFTDAGMHGEYFGNPSLSGSAAFARIDNRIDFDWGNARPGGSTSNSFGNVPADGYSVRWTGQVVPRFSETYQFVTNADAARVYIRPAGSINWTTLADTWAGSGPGQVTGSFAMTLGTTYDVKFEYREDTGTATARLRWQSPSTELEVIDPLGQVGVNLHKGYTAVWADAMKTARNEWGSANDPLGVKLARDSNGWPISDAGSVVWEGRDASTVQGTYLLSFKGKADVSVFARSATFTVCGTNYTALPKGVGYDPATNTTTAFYRPASNTDILMLCFKNTQRTEASAVNTGITDIKLMRPTFVGSTTPHGVDEIFERGFKDALERFTTQRWLLANGNTGEVNWTDRTKPSYQNIYVGSEAVWEYLVMLANETGKDLYITVPMNASTDYVTKLAQLIKFGSDGVNPYTSAQTNPVYPGLNPNLKVYVEWSNETWNWGFAQANSGAAQALNAVHSNTPDGQIINYDGTVPDGDWRRWTGLKTVRASDTFRSVFGDAAMGDRVRFLLGFQYGDLQEVASKTLEFIDHYFNNGDGQNHVATPHPVNYYIWGAGSASYFGANNPRGQQSAISFTQIGFEAPTLADGTATVNPIGSAWTFNGNAGIYRTPVHTSAATVQTLGSTTTAGVDQAVGFKFTTGASPIGVFDLGRWVVSGNSQSHTVRLIRASDKATVASASISTSGAAAGSYKYARLEIPVTLAANTTYYLVSSEKASSDSYHNASTQVTSAPGITIVGAVTGNFAAADSGAPSKWTFTDGPAGSFTFGPVNIRFNLPVGSLGFPQDAPEGKQAVFIGDTGSVSQVVNFDKTGVFALEFYAAHKDGNGNPIRMFVDGVEITPNGSSIKAKNTGWTPGAYGRDSRIYYNYGSAPFTISTTGPHTIEIRGTSGAGKYAYLDSIRIDSVDSIFSPSIPTPTYQSAVSSYATYAQAYGLHVVGYEGGWSVGGGESNYPIISWAAYKDPRAVTAITGAIDSWSRAGYDLTAVGTYYHWPQEDSINSGIYPMMQGIDQRNDMLPVLPTNGHAVPAGLTPATATLGRNNSGVTGSDLAEDGWIYWNILVPSTGIYDFSVSTTAGGTVRVLVDEANEIAEGASGGQITGSIKLSQGLHTLKVKAASGAFSVLGAAVAADNTPFAPSGLTITNLSTLQWTDNATNETGFTLQRSTDPNFASDVTNFAIGANVSSYEDTTAGLVTTFYYRVRANSAGGPSVYSNVATMPPARIPENPTGDTAGLEYRYFEGSWTNLPNFDTLTPAETGTVAIFDSSIRNRENLYGVQFKGYIDVPVDGMYTFYVNSDDGAKLYIGTTLIVNNDGRHGIIEKAGQARLRAGRHAIKLDYFQNTGEQGLNLYYDGPGIAKVEIPADVLSHGGTPGSTNTPPTIANPAVAGSNPVTTTSTTLSVLGGDNAGEGNLSYSWATTGSPPAGVSFSSNNSNAAKNTTVTFTKSGSYSLRVTITDAGGLSTTSTVNVTVSQTLSSIVVTPSDNPTVAPGATQSFTASARDQFGQSMAAPISWSVNGAGNSINSSGLLTAGSTTGSFTVTATSGSITGTAGFTVGSTGSIFTGQADIGNVGTKIGSYSVAGGVYTVKGGGSDIVGTSDHFHFVYQMLSGDGEFVARVASVQNTNSWAKAGVMFRESLASNSRNAFIAVTPGSGITFQRRIWNAGNTDYTQKSGINAPYWVKLVRTGNVFKSFYSVNGSAWTQLGPNITITMGSSIYVGLALTSHNSAQLNMSTFDNVSSTAGPVTPVGPQAVPGGPYSVTEGSTIGLNGSSSTGSGLTYAWDLNYDGVNFTTDATGATPTFSAVGLDGPTTRTIALRVTDSSNATHLSTTTVNITNAAPTATFTGGPAVALGSASSVSFSGQADASPADASAGFTYSYDFNNDGDFADPGDVLNSTSASASHTFASAGTFNVRGRITDSDGGSRDYTTSVVVNSDSSVISASADSYVRDGGYANSNFGTTGNIDVKKDSAGFNREGYFLFDLASVSTITSAKVRIFGKLTNAMAGGLNAGLFGVSDTSWTEPGITFGTRPAAGAQLAQVNVNSTAGQYYEFDVTTYLQQQKALGNTKVSFTIRALNSGSAMMTFNSRNAATGQPQLVIA